MSHKFTPVSVAIRLLTVLAVTATIHAYAGEGGSTAGNGGDVIVCSGTVAGIPWFGAELLDSYEGRSLRGLNIPAIRTRTGSYEDELNRLLTRLERLDPVRAKTYREKTAQFTAEARFLDGATLTDIPDSGHL